MASFPIFRLPIELSLNVLALVPDYHTLISAILAHSRFKEFYLSAPERVLQGVLLANHPQLQTLIFATFRARFRRITSNSVLSIRLKDFIGKYMNKNCKIQFLTRDADPFHVLQVLANCTKETNELAQAWTEFAIYHASRLNPNQSMPIDLAERDRISSVERIRIHRALWRIQLYSELFPDFYSSIFHSYQSRAGPQMPLQELLSHHRYAALSEFFSGLSPWELAELRSVEIFLCNRSRHLSEVTYQYHGYNSFQSIIIGGLFCSWIWRTDCLIGRLEYDTKSGLTYHDLRNWWTVLFPPTHYFAEGEGSDGPNGTWRRIQESRQKTNDAMHRFWEALGLFLWDDERLERYGLVQMRQFTPPDGLDRISVTLEEEEKEFITLCWRHLKSESVTDGLLNKTSPRRPHSPAKVESLLGSPYRCFGRAPIWDGRA